MENEGCVEGPGRGRKGARIGESFPVCKTEGLQARIRVAGWRNGHRSQSKSKETEFVTGKNEP